MLKVSSTDIRTGSTRRALPRFPRLEGLYLTGAPLQEKKARIPVGNTKEHHPPKLPLFFCEYPCTIYEKCCKERYFLNRITKEKYHERPPLFDTENKIFQELHYYT